MQKTITRLQDGNYQIIRTVNVDAPDGSTYPQTSIERVNLADFNVFLGNLNSQVADMRDTLEKIEALNVV